MDVRIRPHLLSGTTSAIPSKSVFHRAAFLACMGDGPCTLICNSLSEDMEATLRAIQALGADTITENGTITIMPARLSPQLDVSHIDCGESGTTLRFALPVAAALGRPSSIVCTGRLPERPLDPLRDALMSAGVILSEPGVWPLRVSGIYRGGNHSLPGNISSQFISGLLLAAAAGGGICLHVSKPVESLPYIQLTCDVLARFGIIVTIREHEDEIEYELERGCTPHCPLRFEVEGDWSSAATWLGAAALGSNISVVGLSMETSQADAALPKMIRNLGGLVRVDNGTLCIEGPLRTGILDISDCPDLAPTLAAIASLSKGQTRIVGAARLRLKESDRLKACADVITSLGGHASVSADELLIEGEDTLPGGSCSSHGDHRIAMMAALMATRSTNDVVVSGARCVAKSYPDFWDEYTRLGGCIERTGS